MKTVYILNAFSLNMLDRNEQLGTPRGYTPRSDDAINQDARCPRPVSNPIEQIAEFEKFPNHWIVKSAVGHETTANIFASVLNREVLYNRETVKLKQGDVAIVGQYIGQRLEEGATELPDGSTIEWWIV